MKRVLTYLLSVMLSACGEPSQHQYQGYIEGENIYLASPYSGVLERLMVYEGQFIQSGQLLYQLDPNPEALLVEQSQANLQEGERILADLKKPKRTQEIAALEAKLNQVEAELELAKIREKRIETLFKKGAISKDNVDEAVAKYRELQKMKEEYQSNLELAKLGSRIEQIRAQELRIVGLKSKLSQAQWQLQQKTMYAPANGVIFDIYFRRGEFVPNQQPVLSLLTPDHIYLEFFVPSEELAQLKINQTIQFRCYGCDKNEEARISYISPEAQYIPPLVYSQVNADKIVFRIKARPHYPLGLKPGQPITVFLP